MMDGIVVQLLFVPHNQRDGFLLLHKKQCRTLLIAVQ